MKDNISTVILNAFQVVLLNPLSNYQVFNMNSFHTSFCAEFIELYFYPWQFTFIHLLLLLRVHMTFHHIISIGAKGFLILIKFSIISSILFSSGISSASLSASSFKTFTSLGSWSALPFRDASTSFAF